MLKTFSFKNISEQRKSVLSSLLCYSLNRTASNKYEIWTRGQVLQAKPGQAKLGSALLNDASELSIGSGPV